MSGIATRSTAEPTTQGAIWYILNHAHFIAAVVLLAGLLMAPLWNGTGDDTERNTVTTAVDYEACVARGVALLDKKIPDWRGLVGLDFDTSGSDCVSVRATQTTYWVGSMEALGLNTDEYEQCGFKIPEAVYHEERERLGYSPYKVLNEVWKAAVLRQRDAVMESA